MKQISILLLSLNFLLFVAGAFILFTKPKQGEKPRMLNSLFIMGVMGGILYLLFQVETFSWHHGSIGILTLLLSLILFTWTAWIHRGQKLSPLNSTDVPTHLVQEGPYQYIRHPYYTSYILSFFGGALLANSLEAMVAVLGIFHLYATAAEQEENKFLLSPLGQDYTLYKLYTGKFFPIIFSQKQEKRPKYPN